MFIIGTKEASGDEWTEHQLLAPSHVDYPDRRNFKTLETLDGNVIVQRPLRDSRPRRFVWRNLPLKSAEYSAQWELLRTFDYRHRLSSGLYPYVGVWEDETGAGGLARMDGSSRILTLAKILQVSRSAEPHFFPETFIEFWIADPTYKEF